MVESSIKEIAYASDKVLLLIGNSDNGENPKLEGIKDILDRVKLFA